MNLITVRADENVRAVSELTLPGIRAYAKRCGADLMILHGEPAVKADDGGPHYRILELGKLLEKYQRILNLDVDLIVRRGCPNLFQVVPPTHVAALDECQTNRREDRVHRMTAAEAFYNTTPAIWQDSMVTYPNSGVLLVSRDHAKIFEPINGKYYTSHGSDDVHLGCQIERWRMPFYSLGPAFNFMTPHSEPPWNRSRFSAYIIHYAGIGLFDHIDPNGTKVDQIRFDLEQIEKLEQRR